MIARVFTGVNFVETDFAGHVPANGMGLGKVRIGQEKGLRSATAAHAAGNMLVLRHVEVTEAVAPSRVLSRWPAGKFLGFAEPEAAHEVHDVL